MCIRDSFCERAFNAPIMRHVELTPGGVGEIILFRTSGISFEKAPAEIKIVRGAGHDRDCRQANGGEQEGADGFHADLDA